MSFFMIINLLTPHIFCWAKRISYNSFRRLTFVNLIGFVVNCASMRTEFVMSVIVFPWIIHAHWCFFLGEGGIGVSNALGANSLAILFALGLPWLIRTLTLVVQNAEQTAVFINSSGIDFVVGSLLVAVASLWITLYIGKFKLRKSVGVILMSLYLVFITFAVLVETGVILDNTVIYMCWSRL